MRALGSLAAMAVLLLAGCMGQAPQPAAPAGSDTPPDVQVTPDRPEPTFGEVQTGPGAAPDTNATLEALPRLVPGEWWRYRFSEPFTGNEVEFVRVIADVQEGGYVVGMPHEGWYKEAVIYHSPALGDEQLDLSYDTHDEHFQPVQFPLTDEATWTTQFSGGPELTASVAVEDAHRARVTFTGPNGNTILELVYDATMHEVVEFVHSTVEYQVLEHGYGFQGWVTIPRGEDLVFIHGRIATALGFGLQPALPPMDTVVIEGGFNRVTFVQIVSSVDPTGQSPAPIPGVYRELVRAPDGTEFVTEAMPGTFNLQFFEHPDPDGAWELEHYAAGPGFVFTEGIAYHQYDVHLPDGAVRSDHSHEVIR